MAKRYIDEPPAKWICFGCRHLGDKVNIPCILIVHANGTPNGCTFQYDAVDRRVKWEKCDE